MALRPMLAAAMTSSCRPELPAATALAVAVVIGLAYLISSSGPIFFSTRSAATYDCTDNSTNTQWFDICFKLLATHFCHFSVFSNVTQQQQTKLDSQIFLSLLRLLVHLSLYTESITVINTKNSIISVLDHALTFICKLSNLKPPLQIC